LEVLDGERVLYTKPLGPFTSWQQQAVWNGRDNDGIVKDGNYVIKISAWSEAAEWNKQTAELAVQVDSSIEIRPLTLASSSSGLLFAPSPQILPPLSFQIEGMMLAGKPLAGKPLAGKPPEDAWDSLPFAAAFRVSILENLELAAAFNAAPEFSGGSPWGVGASVKWVLLKTDAFGAAAEFSYGWAKAGPYTAFGMGTGLGLRLPLAYRILPGAISMDLLLSPLVLWAGEAGYPAGAVPRIGMEGGLLLTYKNIAGGFSVHWDYALPGSVSVAENSGPGPLVSALEIKFFPSNLILSLSGGAWYWDSIAGVFFGAGICVIY
jgi:hypothetical protein